MPWTAQQLRGELFARCEVLEERAEEEGAYFSVRVDQADLDNLSEQLARVG